MIDDRRSNIQQSVEEQHKLIKKKWNEHTGTAMQNSVPKMALLLRLEPPPSTNCFSAFNRRLQCEWNQRRWNRRQPLPMNRRGFSVPLRFSGSAKEFPLRFPTGGEVKKWRNTTWLRFFRYNCHIIFYPGRAGSCTGCPDFKAPNH